MNKLRIDTEFIRLSAALKLAGIAPTGGQAKMYISEGLVSVNGETCLMRGKKLYDKDVFKVSLDGVDFIYEIKKS